MKTIIALLLSLAAQVTLAAPIQFNFDRVELTQFLAATYGDAMKKNFVISPQLLNESKKVTLHLDVERDKLPQFMAEYMQRLGIEAPEKDGVVYLSSAGNAPAAPPAGGPDAMPMLPLPPGGSAAVAVAGMPGQAPMPLTDKEVRLFRPVHRDADFMVAVLNAAFGPNTANRAGGQLVIAVSKTAIDKAMTLAADIDVAPAKVTVSATFVEVSSNDGKSRGFSLIANVLGARLGANVGTTDSGSALSIKSATFEAVINALDSDGRFRQVSNPRVIVDDYEKTTISVGDETPTISGTSLDNNGRQIQQIVYRSSGVILDVLPKVLGNGKIMMTIDGQVSSFQSTTTGVNNSPTLVKRQVKTTLTLDDGEVMVIGGLNDTKSTSNTSGISFLPKFLSVTNEQSSKTELVLVLSAQVSK